MAIARDVARHQRQAEAAQRRALRDAEQRAKAMEREATRLQRERTRTLKEVAREEKARYVQEREQEAADLNEDIGLRLKALDGILLHTLSVNDAIAFDSLRIHEQVPPLVIRLDIQRPVEGPKESSYLASLVAPSGWRKLVPGVTTKYEQAVAAARSAYEADLRDWEIRRGAPQDPACYA